MKRIYERLDENRARMIPEHLPFDLGKFIRDCFQDMEILVPVSPEQRDFSKMFQDFPLGYAAAYDHNTGLLLQISKPAHGCDLCYELSGPFTKAQLDEIARGLGNKK